MASPFQTLAMIKQSPQEVIMIRPSAFGFNEETMASNSFQKASEESEKKIQETCLQEFDAGIIPSKKSLSFFTFFFSLKSRRFVTW